MANTRLEELISDLASLRRIGSYAFAHAIVLTVGLSAMAAMTVVEMRAANGIWFSLALWACLIFFALEWLIHAWLAARFGRLAAYLASGEGIVDAIAVLPVPVALLFGVPEHTAWLLVTLWLLKLTALIPGLAILGRVVALEAKPLGSVLVLFLIVLFLAGVVIHMLEREIQPERFGSLPAGLWWAVTTLTTTGYGDVVPVTPAGRVVGGAIMLCGLGLIGLWTGIMVTGFAAEHRRRDFMTNWELVTKVPFLHSLDPAGIIEITRTLRRLDIPEKTVIVRRGRPGDCMYFIASGEVEVKVEPRPVRLGPGAFFGELALLGGGVRTATVTTTKSTTLLTLDLTDFRTFAAGHPELARAVEAEARRRNNVGNPDLGASPARAETQDSSLTSDT